MNTSIQEPSPANTPDMLCVMEAGGFYNANSQVQATAIARALPLLEKAAAATDPLMPAPIVIVDYGSSQGKNSLEPVSRAIRSLRRRMGTMAPVSVVHVDQPTNDFGALFHTLANDPSSYVRNEPATFPSVVGRSFYEQVVPDGSVTLAWSSYAVNWLSRVPEGMPGCFWPDFAPTVVREALARQQAEDWRRFLALRARELRAGGRIVVVAPLQIPELGSDLDPLMHVARTALVELIKEGALRRREFARMAIPGYGRTLQEYEAPFSDSHSIRLRLEECRAFEIEDPCWTRYLETGDAEGLAMGYAGFFRAAFHPSLLVHLDPDRNPAERQTILNRLSSGIMRRITSDPVRLINLRIVALVIAKPEH